MSDEQLDALAEIARNRGLKLIRSRVRTPGKRRFGKVGLTDKAGKAVFGMDDQGPTAQPEEVEGYLRTLGAKDWGASLDVAVLPRKPQGRPARRAANDPEPAPRPKPAPPPAEAAREAQAEAARGAGGDAPRLAELIRFLGHEIDEKSVRKSLGKLKKLDEMPILATLDKAVVGLIGIHRMVTVHRPAPVGRIPILVVAAEAQGQGLGRLLVEEAERRLRKSGCQIVEVTSNDRRGAAHAFYRHLGYERTSIRFMKKL